MYTTVVSTRILPSDLLGSSSSRQPWPLRVQLTYVQIRSRQYRPV